MEQLNKVELIGTVGTIRMTEVGEASSARLSLATNYAYRSKDGAAVIETTWHNVTAWEGKSFTNLAKFEKGCKVEVEGRLRGQRYTDSEGIERYAFEVVAYHLNLIEAASPLQYEFPG